MSIAETAAGPLAVPPSPTGAGYGMRSEPPAGIRSGHGTAVIGSNGMDVLPQVPCGAADELSTGLSAQVQACSSSTIQSTVNGIG